MSPFPLPVLPEMTWTGHMPRPAINSRTCARYVLYPPLIMKVGHPTRDTVWAKNPERSLQKETGGTFQHPGSAGRSWSARCRKKWEEAVDEQVTLNEARVYFTDANRRKLLTCGFDSEGNLFSAKRNRRGLSGFIAKAVQRQRG
jgi:Fe-S cluster biosynthesis and repair protein YggX